MRAMVFRKAGEPLTSEERPIPIPLDHQVLIKVSACGICRTDLHIIDGELPSPTLPLILGHQIVGTIVSCGKDVTTWHAGMKVGVPWLGKTCGSCSYCTSDHENLCDNALYTGYTVNGGFAEYAVADADYIFLVPKGYSDSSATPLFCAGLIGYRSLKMIEEAQRIGFYGFGAAAHILLQVALFQKRDVYIFTRKKEHIEGATWVGTSSEAPPERLDAAILFAPLGEFFPLALQHVKKGGTVISAGIHMSDIPTFAYSLLWEERVMRTVANLTRADAEEFLALAPLVPIETNIKVFPLAQCNEALKTLREGTFAGTVVIEIGEESDLSSP